MWVRRDLCAQAVGANADHHAGEWAPPEESRRAVAALLLQWATPAQCRI